MYHDFSGPTIYDPADFTPVKKCKSCGLKVNASYLAGWVPPINMGGCPAQAAAGGYLDPKYAKQASSLPVLKNPPTSGGSKDLAENLKEFAEILEKELKPRVEALQATRCECGAYKASGVGRGQVGHSSWCPWSTP